MPKLLVIFALVASVFMTVVGFMGHLDSFSGSVGWLSSAALWMAILCAK